MHKFTKLFTIGSICLAMSVMATACATSQSSSEATTTEEVIQQTIPTDEHNAKLTESIRILTDLCGVLDIENAEKEQAKADTAKKEEASTEAKEEKKAEESSTEVKAEESSTEAKAEESSTEAKAEESSTEAKAEESSTEGKDDKVKEASTEVKEEKTAQQESNGFMKEVKPLAFNQMVQGFALGNVKDNVYENTYWGITYPLDPSWTVDSREQMLAYDRISLLDIDESTLVNTLQGAPQFTDLYVTIQDGDANIIVSTSNLDSYKKQFQGHKSAQEYFYKKLYKHFEKCGYTDILVTKDEKKIGTTEYEVLDIQMKDGDIPYFAKAMFAKKDHFLNTILFTCKNENVTDIMLSTLTAIKK